MAKTENLTGNNGLIRDVTNNVSQRIAPAVLAVRSAGTLFGANYGVDVYRDVYARVKTLPLQEPLNREHNVVHGVIDVIRRRSVKTPASQSITPYWDNSARYDPLELFGTLIQYLDYHKSPAPKTVLPPEVDAVSYINKISERGSPATVVDQLNILLDITGNNIVGAVNLGFIASRFMARGMDMKAYPNIGVDREEMLRWGQNVAEFEINDGRTGDSAGDTYYFWTHVMAGLVFNLYDRQKPIYNITFEHGTEIMRIVRKKFSKLATTSEHYEPSVLGRAIGLGLSQPDWYVKKEAI